MAVEKAASSIAVDTFRSTHDDFEEWISLFEDAVVLGTGVTDADRKKALYLKWLPFKLDEQARTVRRSIASNEYEEVKRELKALLIDPQEAYKWQTGRSCIQWDGKESFHALAVRIRRAVDKYDPDAVKNKQYFFRFRLALPKKFRTAIDLGCAEDKRTIEEAKKIALRLQMAEADDDKDDKGREVTFTGASMADDRLKSLEMDFKRLDVRMETFEEKIDGVSEQLKELVAKSKGYESSLERYDSRYPDRRRGSQDRRDSRDRRDSQNNYNGGYGNNSRDRREYTGYRDQRDDRERYDSRYGEDRHRSWDQRDSADASYRRDNTDGSYRRDSRDQNPSQDWSRDNRREGSQDQDGKGSTDEDYDLYCAAISNIEERRAKRLKN